jgi:hypothetical protein
LTLKKRRGIRSGQTRGLSGLGSKNDSDFEKQKRGEIGMRGQVLETWHDRIWCTNTSMNRVKERMGKMRVASRAGASEVNHEFGSQPSLQNVERRRCNNKNKQDAPGPASPEKRHQWASHLNILEGWTRPADITGDQKNDVSAAETATLEEKDNK